MRIVALLRGINVGGGNKIPMSELRDLCWEAGWHDVRTYIASGNVLITSQQQPAAIESALETLIEARFGLTIPVIVRTEAQWRAYAVASPFPQAEMDEPNRLMLCLTKRPLLPDAVAQLRARATGGERIVEDRGALWTHYPQGAGDSKLSPDLFDRLAGSPLTARNWRTVIKTRDMLSE